MRIIGNLRSFANKKSINVYDLSIITDYNFIIYHMSSCLFGHLYYTKVPVVPFQVHSNCLVQKKHRRLAL